MTPTVLSLLTDGAIAARAAAEAIALATAKAQTLPPG